MTSQRTSRGTSLVDQAGRRLHSEDPKPVCPICGGVGYITADVPIGHPDFGKAIPCECQTTENAGRRIERLRSMSNLGDLTYLTFDTFLAEPAHLAPDKAYNLRRAYETCSYFAEEPDGWLLLTGTYGCGKTHLAAAIANARLTAGKTAVFMVVPDLLDHLRSTYAPRSGTTYDDLFEQIRTTPLLILDDLGTQSSTEWAQEKLFQLLNHRYNAKLATVITTNQRIDEIDPRVRSRLQDPNLVNHYAIIAPDFRAGQNAMPGDLSTLGFYRDKTFETFNENRPDLDAKERLNLQQVYAETERYAQDPSGWLVISGETGAGKTHLAAAIANHLLNVAFGDVMFIVAPDLLDHLRAAFSPSSNTSYDRRFNEIKNAPCLVLDDLGTESATPWAREKFYQLLNYRYSARFPTVITTTKSVTQVEPWLRTRMQDEQLCTWCLIKAPGFRTKRNKRS